MPEEQINASSVNDSEKESTQEQGADQGKPQDTQQQVKQEIKTDPTPKRYNFDGQNLTALQLFNAGKANQSRADAADGLNRKLSEDIAALTEQVKTIASRPVDDGVVANQFSDPGSPEYQKHLRQQDERHTKIVEKVVGEKMSVVTASIEGQQRDAQAMLQAQDQADVINKANKEYVEYLQKMADANNPIPDDIHQQAFNDITADIQTISKRPAYFKKRVEELMADRGLSHTGLKTQAKAEKKAADLLAQTQVTEGSGSGDAMDVSGTDRKKAESERMLEMFSKNDEVEI